MQQQPSITVDTGRREDASRITAFQIAMADETEDFGLDPDTVASGVDRMLDMPDRGFYVVSRGPDDKAVASLLVLKEWSDWRNTDVWWIHSLYVSPEYRRKGVFRAMFEYVRDLADENNVAGLRLYVERNNLNARRSYESLGMSCEHYDMYELFFNGD